MVDYVSKLGSANNVVWRFSVTAFLQETEILGGDRSDSEAMRVSYCSLAGLGDGFTNQEYGYGIH
jgi:hypothetical protein